MPEDPDTLRYVADEIRLERDHLGDVGAYVMANHYNRTLTQVKERLFQEETKEEQVAEIRRKSARHMELEGIVGMHVDGWDRTYEAFRERAET
jgi:hypothetical protein